MKFRYFIDIEKHNNHTDISSMTIFMAIPICLHIHIFDLQPVCDIIFRALDMAPARQQRQASLLLKCWAGRAARMMAEAEEADARGD